jgi:hypothetical protein
LLSWSWRPLRASAAPAMASASSVAAIIPIDLVFIPSSRA